MPFDGNKWNTRKFLPYQEMLSAIKKKWPNLQRDFDSSNDTAKVINYKPIMQAFLLLLTAWFCVSHSITLCLVLVGVSVSLLP